MNRISFLSFLIFYKVFQPKMKVFMSEKKDNLEDDMNYAYKLQRELRF